MTNSILNLIIKDIDKSNLVANSNVTEIKLKKYQKTVYKDGLSYQKLTYSLLVFIDTGDWFDKLVKFELVLDQNTSIIKYKKGYGCNYDEFEKNQYKKVSQKIINEICSFGTKKDFVIRCSVENII